MLPNLLLRNCLKDAPWYVSTMNAMRSERLS